MANSSALLMGYYGARNVGDDLMLEFLTSWLRQQGLGVNVLGEQRRALELCGGEGTFTKNVPLAGEWGFPGVWLRGEAGRVVRAIRDADHLVIGGGDLFRDDRGWRTLLYTYEKVLLADLVGTPVHLVNVGIGAPQTALGRYLYKLALPKCRTLLVRDERSLKICHEVGADHARLVPDVVLAMESRGDPGPVPDRPYMVVALRFLFREGKNIGLEEGRLQNLARSLDRLVADHDLDVLFVPFQDMEGWNDEVLHKNVQELMDHKDRCTHQTWTGDFSSLVALFSEATVVAAMPLHAAVIALYSGARAVLISYDQKCEELAARLNGGVSVSLDALDDLATLEGALGRAISGEGLSGLEEARGIWAEAKLTV